MRPTLDTLTVMKSDERKIKIGPLSILKWYSLRVEKVSGHINVHLDFVFFFLAIDWLEKPIAQRVSGMVFR